MEHSNSRPNPELESAIDAYLRDLAEGRDPSIDDFCDTYPAQADVLRERLSELKRILAASPGVSPATNLSQGQLLDGFRVLRRLGEGGMATVYEAEQLSLNRTVALKVIRGNYSAAEADRLRREAEVLARLRHQHIVNVLAAGGERGVPYIAMELVSGKSLAAWYAEHASSKRMVPTSQLIPWIASIARALSCAHDQGIIHRDVKPSNILIEDGGRALLSDFGLAQIQDSETRTLTGSFRGTPQYAAPEQVERLDSSRPLDGRVDVYSLGVTLYEGLTGVAPFRGSSLTETFKKILKDDPVRPRELRPTISKDLEIVVLKAIEKEPSKRYPSAREFAEDLEALSRLEPIHARPASIRDKIWKWIRRNPTQAAALGVAALASSIAGGVEGARFLSEAELLRDAIDSAMAAGASHNYDDASRSIERALAIRPHSAAALQVKNVLELERRQFESEVLLQEVRRAIVLLDALRQETHRAGTRLGTMRTKFTSAYMSDTELSEMNREELQLSIDLGRITNLQLEIEEKLGRATALVGPSATSRDASAEYYYGRAEEELRNRNHTSADLYREKIREHDPDEKWIRRLEGRNTLRMEALPSGAEAFLFRFELQSRIKPGGEQRLVAVPYNPVAGSLYPPLAADARLPQRGPVQPIYPGDCVLQIREIGDGALRDAGLRTGDYILAVEDASIEACLFVSEVDPKSPEARAGIRPMDRVVRIGDISLERGGDAWATSFCTAFDLSRRPSLEFLSPEGVRRVLAAEDGQGSPLPLPGYKYVVARDLVMQPAIASALSLRCWSRGRSLEVTRGPGRAEKSVLEQTANPLLCTPANSIGSPFPSSLELPRGSYICVAFYDGTELLRNSFVVEPETPPTTIRFPTAPPLAPTGFVWIESGPARVGGDSLAVGSLPIQDARADGFWIQDHETTHDEYSLFLNDSATLAEIAKEKAAGRTTYVPRSPSRPQGTWRLSNGRWEPNSPSIAGSYPVVGLSFDDALAYAAWRESKARANHEPWTFTLPTELEWELSARGADGRSYPWGDSFSWRNCNSPWLLAAGRTLLPARQVCRDESAFGVRDLAGSVREWCLPSHPSQSADKSAAARGSTFNNTDPLSFRSAARIRSSPATIDGVGGVRLVAHSR